MNFKTTGCCGVLEITNLSQYSDPRAAMMAFCKNQLDKGASFDTGYYISGKIYNNYLFTAAVYDEDCSSWYSYKDRKEEIEDGIYRPYGQKFAKFIEDNNLGVVITTGAEINEAFHPDHKVQCWLWRANHENLIKWYATEKPKAKLYDLETKLAEAKRMVIAYGHANYYGDTWKKKVTEYEEQLQAEKARLDGISQAETLAAAEEAVKEALEKKKLGKRTRRISSALPS